MAGKTDKQFLFDVQLNWLSDGKGSLTSRNTAGAVHVATPPEFGGEGKPWSPEHLFLGSLSSCFMTTFLSFAQKMHFSISHFDCDYIGQVEMIGGRYQFTTINLYPRIHIAGETARQKATLALEKTHKYCIVSASVNATIYYHSEILVDTNPETRYPGLETVALNTGQNSPFEKTDR